MALFAVVKSKIKNHPKIVVGCLLIIVVVAGALIYVSHRSSSSSDLAAQQTELSNQALMSGDKASALKYAKQALAQDPNNVDNIVLVANLTATNSPTEAKQYYVQALDAFKQKANPDSSGKTTITYWAAAGLAKQAGETAQAKQYYNKVIQTANKSDAYENSIAQKSQAELARLK